MCECGILYDTGRQSHIHRNLIFRFTALYLTHYNSLKIRHKENRMAEKIYDGMEL
jgi:hypothetical protein